MPASPETDPPTTDSCPSSPADVVNAYLDAFYVGDFGRARQLVADDFAFRGPFLQVDGADGFFSGAAGLRGVVAGHRLIRQWVDAAEVCSIYDMLVRTPGGGGQVMMSEWHSVGDGRIVAARLLFDSSAFRALVPAPTAT